MPIGEAAFVLTRRCWDMLIAACLSFLPRQSRDRPYHSLSDCSRSCFASFLRIEVLVKTRSVAQRKSITLPRCDCCVHIQKPTVTTTVPSLAYRLQTHVASLHLLEETVACDVSLRRQRHLDRRSCKRLHSIEMHCRVVFDTVDTEDRFIPESKTSVQQHLPNPRLQCHSPHVTSRLNDTSFVSHNNMINSIY